MSHRHRTLAAVVALLLLTAALRFHRLGAQSFWNDEGNSARLSERSLAAIVEGTASDVHPPLYYVLLRGWRELAGETEFGLRALSAFAGLLTVAVVFALTKLDRSNHSPPDLTGLRRPVRSTPRRSSFIALLFAAASPVLVYYSQETRMYALLALLAAAGTWALLLWLGGAGWRWAVAYVLLAAAGLYTHYFFPAIIVAQGLLVVGRVGNPPLRRLRGGLPTRATLAAEGGLPTRPTILPLAAWLLMAATAAALYLPWLPIFLRQVGGRGGERVPLPAFLADSWRWMVLGSTVGRYEATWALVAAAALVAIGLFVALRPASDDADSALRDDRRRTTAAGLGPPPVVRRPPSFHPLSLAAFIVVPLALMYLVGATDPAFFKFLLTAVPFLCLLMGLGWAAPRRRLWLPGLLTALVLAGSAVSLANLYADPAYARADYRGMAARIAADVRNVGVILVAPNQWEVFTYYHRDGAPVYPLPPGQPDPALLEPELARIAAAHERLYVLYWGEGQRDPQGVIERWLDANTFKVSEEWVGDVRFVVYAVAPAATAAPTPSGATFAALDGETITLREYAVWPVAARPGDVVGVRLVWSADATPARPYKVFLHLLAPDGRLVAQRDGEPGGGSRPTTGWAASEAVIDNHGLLLPSDLPPGEYELRVGMYDAFDPAARLPVDGGDSLPLGVITVEKEERNAE